MFRITEDPSSGNLVQCLAKNYKNDSIVSVDMGKFGIVCVCSSLYRKEGASYNHTHAQWIRYMLP